MQIQIPDDAVPEIERRAVAAGFADVEQYILTLVIPKTERIAGTVAEIDKGFASGVSDTPLKEFLRQLRTKLVQQNSASN